MNHKKEEKKINAGFSQVAQMFASMVHISRKKIGKKNFIQTSVGHIQIHKMNKRSQLFLPFLINACVIHNVKVITLLKLDIYRLVV